MRTPVDDELVREAEAVRLRFSCVHCAFFDSTTGACSEGYPNDALSDVRLDAASSIEFCKSFELA